MRKKTLPIVMITLWATAFPGAGSGGIRVGVTGGTLGLGVQAAYVFNSHFAVRGVAAALNFSTEFETSELRYPVRAELRNAGVLIDYRPWGGQFRISGGLYFNDNTLSGKAVCQDPDGCNLDDDAARELMKGDRVTGQVHFNSVAPYLGVGWSGAPGNSGWHFHVDLGVLYLGDPEAEADVQRAACTGNGRNLNLIPNFSGCNIPVDKQAAAEIEDTLESLSLYPVVMVGVGYRF